ncbi:hypothetical protein GLOIN_2v553318 [Rhizophagus irregularis DAOM 181602=DAOM 197198]|uniref:Uncharacterized protein n=1 Tax=Rhizophagus irregularis (strain DAOM 181602 / DAOM 197198 / MUCL 43194) TaxID=747089 RepID=A0A2P4PDC2_RHIID|nr:hypothetical protein GLOIN_2v553318 [Rhizophagus irregularis DAOM 181602=DAOM 197198]POG63383.1 hypothetical protein GLOIN_2v553318 [Rhizophagus irregularis DAOM 181602=DAOM 197198]|eukprot:XP_025170249.1 hypothetical protein GLOIN_2v553318 [Rhizophagus irregularis DAOM 181602=DAOM 197198]
MIIYTIYSLYFIILHYTFIILSLYYILHYTIYFKFILSNSTNFIIHSLKVQTILDKSRLNKLN